MRDEHPLFPFLARRWRVRLVLAVAAATIAIFVRFLIVPAIGARQARAREAEREPEIGPIGQLPLPGAIAQAVLAVPATGDVRLDGRRMDETSAIAELRELARTHPGARVLVRSRDADHPRAQRLRRVIESLGLEVESAP